MNFVPYWPLLATYLIGEASLMKSSRWNNYISALPRQPYSLLCWTRLQLDRYSEASRIRERAIERITNVIGTHLPFFLFNLVLVLMLTGLMTYHWFHYLPCRFFYSPEMTIKLSCFTLVLKRNIMPKQYELIATFFFIIILMSWFMHLCKHLVSNGCRGCSTSLFQGVITEDVVQLRKAMGASGMAVLLFGFGSDADNPHLPHNHERNQVVSTGTHDNDMVLKYLSITEEDGISWALIKAVLSSVPRAAIISIQDILGLGCSTRMNIPATQFGNWSWGISLIAWRSKQKS